MKEETIIWDLSRFTHDGIIYADHTLNNVIEDLSVMIRKSNASKLIIDTNGVNDIDDAASLDIWQCVLKKNEKFRIRNVKIDCNSPSMANYSLLSAYKKVNFGELENHHRLPLLLR